VLVQSESELRAGGECRKHAKREARVTRHPSSDPPGRLMNVDPVVTGGLIGIGGTLVGVGAQEALTIWREKRRDRRFRRRAVTAIVSELIATVSILDKALERQAWWPEGDEPRSDAWERYRDGLADELDTETLMRIGIVYDSIRSLAATRSSPLAPDGPGPLRRLIREDPQGRSFFSLFGKHDRWPGAAHETQHTRNVVWNLLVETLRPVQRSLLRRDEPTPWQPDSDSDQTS
jgi:hypothetical protein